MSIFTRLKKPLLIILFIVLVIALGYLIFITFFSSQEIPSGPASSTSTSSGGSFPVIGENEGGEGGEITGPGRLPDGKTPEEENPIIEEPAPESNRPQEVAGGGLTKTTPVVISETLDPSLSSNGNVNFYNKDDGYFYTLDRNGNLTKLSDKIFHSVENVTWSKQGDKAVIEYPDGSKISYNFNSKEQVSLPSYWEDFSFSPDGEQISGKSLGLDENNRWLIVSNADASESVALESIGNRADYVYPSWSPNNQIVAYYTKGVDFDRQEIFFVGLNGENFKSTIVEGRGIESQWSSEGNTLLYSAYNSTSGYRPSLWMVGANGENIGANRQSLQINTWANKCTFANDSTVYCAVPESLPEGAGLIPEVADSTKDNLYKIDLSTGAKTLIAVPDGSYNVSNIMVPDSQDRLYFTDKHNNMIYEIRLK